MDMSGDILINANKQSVWDALNDADVLVKAIPGAESVEKTSDTEFTAVAKNKIGPVTAKFKGTVTLSDIDAPNGYTISGQGSGGAAGFAKGSAKVALADEGDLTRLSYEVHATVGGKLAQIGQRLVDSSAKKMADEFFDKFSAIVGGPLEEVEGLHPDSDAIAPTDAPLLPDEDFAEGLSPWTWGPGVIIIGLALAWFFAS
ncbi:MAG: carbon monoxide dehydrogenase subunit G [Parvibaculaceae bacterium]|nr:carbon monoxide dehydrogenase subunit G [Parvibaculaceae bacterium]